MSRTHRALSRIAWMLFASLLALASFASAPIAAGPRQINVVIIVADDLSFELMDRLPNVQRLLVDQGMTFTNMFAVDPLCCPSRVAFLRGQYAHTTGEYNVQYAWGGWSRALAAGLETQTLPVWLRRAGYYTAEQGKYLNGYDEAAYIPPGWTDWDAMLRVGYEPGTWTASSQGRAITPTEYGPDWVSDQAVHAIQASGSSPLFMWTAYFDPHAPSVPPPRYSSLARAASCRGIDVMSLPGFDERATDTVDGTSDKPRWIQSRPAYSATQIQTLQTGYEHQCEAALAMDDGVGRIVDALEAKDPGLRSTAIVFTSDQGLQNGAHMQVQKKVPWDESARLPFVLRDDGLLHGHSSVSTELLGNIDLAPTVLELTGASGDPGCGTDASVYAITCRAGGKGFDGYSFASLLAGRGYPARSYLLIEHWDPSALLDKVPTYCAVRSLSGLLVRYWADNTSMADWEGYDLRTDPHMLHSVVYSPVGTPATATPSFRPGGKALYQALAEPLRHLCDPRPPEYPGFG
jgi:arylsulfatase A-like enzyme